MFKEYVEILQTRFESWRTFFRDNRGCQTTLQDLDSRRVIRELLVTTRARGSLTYFVRDA